MSDGEIWKLRHVNNHLTPLALLIVLPGLVAVPQPRIVIILTLVLMAYSLVINLVSVYLAPGHVGFFTSLRVGSNYAVNICLLWLLYSTWPLAWMLLFLMSMGAAVYQSRRDAFLSGAAISTLLVSVHWSFGAHTLEGWTVVAVEVGIIVLFNLFVNGLVRATEQASLPEDTAPEEP